MFYKIFTLILCFIFFNSAEGQEEYKIHLKSIDSTYLECSYADNDSIFNANKAFVDYVLQQRNLKETDIKYISNRKLLPQLNNVTYKLNTVTIHDTLITGELCEIVVKTDTFYSEKHSIDTVNSVKLIDNLIPYGGYYSTPGIEITNIQIKIDEFEIEIPHSAYAHLYNPNIELPNRWVRGVEAYTSLNGAYIYLYIYGGNNANVYMSKLIFSKKNYITKFVADYNPLSTFNGFSSKLIGF